MRQQNVQIGRPLLVISPHCDDAVFGCGALLAAHRGATVVTLFAGAQPAGAAVTPWDRQCGFRDGDDVMAQRRREDACALALLGATPRWLDFRDAQYGRSPDVEELAEAIERTVLEGDYATILFPFGLFHSDHQLAHAATLKLATRHPERQWQVYEDALYRTLPGLLEERQRELKANGWHIRRQEMLRAACAQALKQGAVHAYASQLRGLAQPGCLGHADASAEEGHWAITKAA